MRSEASSTTGATSGGTEPSSTSTAREPDAASTTTLVPAATSTETDEMPSFELGTGLGRFVALADGDALELVAGLQGGWHVDVAVRTTGVEPDGLTLTYEAFDAESGASLSHRTFAALESANVLWTQAGWVRVGDRVVFDITAAKEVVGALVCLRVEAEGPTFDAVDERCVVITPPP